MKAKRIIKKYGDNYDSPEELIADFVKQYNESLNIGNDFMVNNEIEAMALFEKALETSNPVKAKKLLEEASLLAPNNLDIKAN